ncbi:hypothetical protein Trydic_g12042, partial [Trypoxylus dichotomus]
MSSKQLDGCFNLYNRYRCSGGLCYRRENYCPENYVISPYDEGECVRRCNTDSCGKGHCSPLGMCVCLFGYRPDPLNPRTCTKIPMNPPDPQPSGYRESTGYTASIVADNNKEKMPAENTSFNLYTMISAFIAAILLITTSVLIFVIIKLKRSPRNRANPQEQNEEANSENHYSIIKFENESNDGIPVKHIIINFSCPSYKTNKTRCGVTGYVGDPLTNECIARCSTPCELGKCRSCYCLLPTANMPSKELENCFNLYNRYHCGNRNCVREENYCPENYVISLYDSGECVRRCNSHSCNKGYCSPYGTCVCYFGYRPDPLNPRTCIKIPTNSPDPQLSGPRETTTYNSSIMADDDKKKTIAGNMSSNLYTMISAFIAAVLLATTSVLIFIIIKL